MGQRGVVLVVFHAPREHDGSNNGVEVQRTNPEGQSQTALLQSCENAMAMRWKKGTVTVIIHGFEGNLVLDYMLRSSLRCGNPISDTRKDLPAVFSVSTLVHGTRGISLQPSALVAVSIITIILRRSASSTAFQSKVNHVVKVLVPSRPSTICNSK